MSQSSNGYDTFIAEIKNTVDPAVIDANNPFLECVNKPALEAISRVLKNSIDKTEDALRVAAEKSCDFDLELLKVAFWDEVVRARKNFENISYDRISKNSCVPVEIVINVIQRTKENDILPYLVREPANYQTRIRAAHSMALNALTKGLKDLMDRCRDGDAIDVKELNAIHSIWQKLDERIYGKAVQRTENLYANVTPDKSSGTVIDIKKELELLREKQGVLGG